MVLPARLYLLNGSFTEKLWFCTRDKRKYSLFVMSSSWIMMSLRANKICEQWVNEVSSHLMHRALHAFFAFIIQFPEHSSSSVCHSPPRTQNVWMWTNCHNLSASCIRTQCRISEYSISQYYYYYYLSLNAMCTREHFGIYIFIHTRTPELSQVIGAHRTANVIHNYCITICDWCKTKRTSTCHCNMTRVKFSHVLVYAVCVCV